MPDGEELAALQTLYDQSPCGFASFGPDGRFVRVNATFCAMVGREGSELVGVLGLGDLLPIGGRIYLETHVVPLLEMTGRAAEIAFDLVRPDGSRAPVLTTSVVERGPDGAVLATHAAVFDARDRRAFEQELVAQRQRAEAAEGRARQLVRTLQLTLVPPVPPEVPDLLLASAYRPAGGDGDVGGDFFDVFQLSAQEWGIVVGDVRGKGVEAAILTALIRHTVREESMRRELPSQVLARLNQVLLDRGASRFCTAVLVRLHRTPEGWGVCACSAGHPLALHASSGPDVKEVGEPGTLLGVMPRPRLIDASLTLRPGEGLLLYTDGITEARRGDDFFDLERLRALLAIHGSEPSELVAEVLSAVSLHEAGVPSDDVVLISIAAPRVAPTS